MSCLKPVSTAAIVLGLSAPAALADVTGAQVWSDWKAYFEGLGYETSATETTSGNTLTVSGITFRTTLPEGAGDLDLSMGSIGFTDNSDGTVSVDLPAIMPLGFNLREEGEPGARGTLLIEQTAPVMLVSGDPDDFTYVYSADAMTLRVQDLEADGEAVPQEMFSFALALGAVSSTTRTAIGEMRSYDATFAAQELTYDMAFDVPEGPDQGSGAVTGTMSGVQISGDGVYAPGMDSSDLGAMIAAGARVSSAMTYRSGSSNIEADTPDGAFSAATSSDGGSLGIEMNEAGLRYDIAGTGVAMTAQMQEFPLPVSLEIAESAFSLGVPVMVGPDPQPFDFGIALRDFTVSDTVWSLFDPGAQLPRDPATVALELSGTARVLSDIFDPMAMAMGDAPGELTSLAVRTLLVDLIGARLSGAGSFTFDNSDLSTFGGVPRPEGALDLRLEGGNALIDTLVGMGLLPQEQAMGARMMMGLFGVPQGDDTLTSKIEINAEGHVLANGQRLQ